MNDLVDYTKLVHQLEDTIIVMLAVICNTSEHKVRAFKTDIDNDDYFVVYVLCESGIYSQRIHQDKYHLFKDIGVADEHLTQLRECGHGEAYKLLSLNNLTKEFRISVDTLPPHMIEQLQAHRDQFKHFEDRYGRVV